MDKIEKVKQKIEELKSKLIHGACSSQVAMETRCKEEAYNEVLAILDSMQEEPISDESEKAAEQDVCEVVNSCSATGIPNDHIPSWVQDAMINEFIHGAQWQKEQDQETIELAEDHAMLAGRMQMKEEMMKDAVGGYVIKDIEEGNGDFLLSADYLPKSMGLKDQQRVKVIVIKED